MFEDAELGHALPKAAYEAEVPGLRTALLEAQYALLEQPAFPVVVLIGGVDGAGKGETGNTLNAWLDPRHVEVTGFGDPTEEERARPPLWRFWRALPRSGRIALFFGSWYTAPIVDCVADRGTRRRWERFSAALEEISRFERMLADDGVRLVKFWFHLSKEAQRKRLRTLSRDPATAWRVTKRDWHRFRAYDDFREVSERALRHPSLGHAPWIVIEGTDARYRNIAAARALLAALQAPAAPPVAPPVAVALPAATPAVDARTVLNTMPRPRAMSAKRYADRLEKWQGRLAQAVRRMADRRSAVVVFEGMDAAGKGSAIRRITEALDARLMRVVPVAAPTEEERAHPWLWRFWRHLPPRGHLTLFDRSWYGRVLVERVERLGPAYDWQRAYGEINDFEEALSRHGIVVVKFWLAVSKAEQLRRFREREATGFKHFKITAEDYRNRKKWPQYEAAVRDMIERTGTSVAPWTLVPADDKHAARIMVLRTLARRLAEA